MRCPFTELRASLSLVYPPVLSLRFMLLQMGQTQVTL